MSLFRIKFFIILIIVNSCNNHSEKAINPIEVNSSSINKIDTTTIDSVSKLESALIKEIFPEIKYRMLVLNDSVREQLSKQFPDSNLIILCAINRIDPDRLHRADSLMIPDSIYFDLNIYSPYPQKLSIADSVDKLILISYRYQAFALYAKGELEKWGPVSMGAKKTQTPTGLFHTNWKSKSQISTDNSDWILPWYFNLVNHTGVSLHQFELPGFPASHSCIRLRLSDAEYIYYFAEQWKLDEKGWKILVEGTPVIIFGEYPFGKPRPWFESAVNPDAGRISTDTLQRVIKEYLPTIMEEQRVRNDYFIELARDSVL